MEKKKYILKDEMSDLMGDLMERTMKMRDKVSLETNLRRWSDEMVLEITIRSKETYKTIGRQVITVIDEMSVDYEIASDIFDAACSALVKEQEEQKAVEEQTEEETTNN